MGIVRIIGRSSAILLVAVLLGILILPIGLSILPRAIQIPIPQYVLEYAQEHGLDMLIPMGDNTYQIGKGSFITFLEAQPAEAASYLFNGNTSDGHIYKSGPDYPTVWNASTGTVSSGANTFTVGQTYSGDTTYYIYRGGLFFDTTSIPANATISEAYVGLRVAEDYSMADYYLCLVDGSDLSVSGLVIADYGQLKNADNYWGAINSSYFVADEYFYISLMESAIGAINKSGYTQYGLRSFNDMYAIAPGGNINIILRPDGDESIGTTAAKMWNDYWYGDHYLMVDEIIPDGMGSYIYEWLEDDVMEWDWYSVQNATGVNGSISYIKVWSSVYAQRYLGGQPAGWTSLGVGGDGWEEESGQQHCGAYPPVFEMDSYTWTTNPNTSVAWTWGDVDNLTVGVGMNTTGGSAMCSQIYAEVWYIPEEAGPEYATFYSREAGTGYTPYLVVTYQVGDAPCAPVNLLCEGEGHPKTNDESPEFSALGCHPQSEVNLTSYSIYVDNNFDFSSPVWSSGQTSMANITDGERCGDITYGGIPLDLNTRHYWKIKFWDEDNDESPWSETAYFDFATPSDCPTNLLANPTSPTEITITWKKADLVDYTGLYYKRNSYPSSRSDGTQIYLGSGEYYYHKQLTPGANYYYRAWGYNPTTDNWSDCYDDAMATTPAGEGGGGPDVPDVPKEWEQAPTCNAYSKTPFITFITGAADSMEVPHGTACLMCTMGLIMMVGIAGFFVAGRSEFVLLAIISVGIIAASIAEALPMWFIAIGIALGGGILYIWKRA